MPRSAKLGGLGPAEVADAVEAAFGEGSVGRAGDASATATEEARAMFVRVCVLLLNKQRHEALDNPGDVSEREKMRIRGEVRAEVGAFLGVDENEVFRLHHRAAGKRAADPDFRKAAQAIERELGFRYGMVV